MTTFVLHGGFTSTKNALNAGFYGEFSKYVSDGANILLIYFARKDDEIPKLFEEDERNILEQAGNKKFEFTVASSNDFMEQLKNANVLYMRGGDTDKLLGTLKQHPEFGKIIQGKVVIGSSAGAYVLAQYYYSGSKNGVFEGLGTVPVRVTCHYESKIMKREADQKGVAALEKYPQNLELIVLRDYEWKTIIL